MFDLPVAGHRVTTLDCSTLGTVAELGDGKFRVDGDDGSRWLRQDAVFTVEQSVVTLVCNLGRLDAYVAPEM
jgi:hypothetical protein